MFLKNCWYMAAFVDEVSTKPLARTLVGEPLVLFRQIDGTAVALEDRCCHRGLPLVHGEVVAEGIQCGYHGLVFDAAGRCVRIPGQDLIPKNACVRSYPLAERDGVLWFWPGDPALANIAEIEAYRWHNEPGWSYKGSLNEVAANHQLIVDNLLDLTHVGYVHRSTIGGQPDAHSNAEMKTSRTDNSVSVVRWLRNSLPPPTYKLAAGFTGRVDRWIEIEFKPGIITIHAGAMDVGSGADTGADTVKREGAFWLRTMHAVTPETETTSHYFWTIAHRVRAGMPELTERVHRELVTAFAEDKIIIEAQFARLQQRPLPPLVGIRSDAPVVQAGMIVAARIRREQETAQGVGSVALSGLSSGAETGSAQRQDLGRPTAGR